MKIRLVKLSHLSGNQASIYSVIYENDKISLFEKFINENNNSFKSELKDIISRLLVIGNTTGAREQFFKLNEGVPGDGVCALYDDPHKNLRLYCIRCGTTFIIVGGGGPKPKTVRALQEDPKLNKENTIIRKISKLITDKLTEGDITFTNDYLDLTGTLALNDK